MVKIYVKLLDLLCFLEGSPSEAFLAYTLGLGCCSATSFLFLDLVDEGDAKVSLDGATTIPLSISLVGSFSSPS